VTTPRADLGQAVVSAARWSFTSSIVQRGAQVVVGVIVARLVAPADMGVYAIALVVIALVVGISELGVAVGVIRSERPLAQIAPTAVAIAWSWSGAVTVGVLAGAPWLASTLGSPDAAGPLRLMAFAVLVGGLSAVPGAVAQRTFRHRRRAVSELVGFAVGALTTVILAAAGAGAWSLAAGRLVTNLVGAAVLVSLPALRYRPAFAPSVARELLRVGVPLTGAGLLALALWQVDSVVVGHGLGSTALGVYALAFNLASWPVTALTVAARSVTLPTFAELRGDPERLTAALPVALGTVLTVAAPAVALLMVTGPSLVRVVYGMRWNAAGEVLVILAVLGGLRVAVDVMIDFLTAAGRTGTVLWVHLAWLAALVPALVLGSAAEGLLGVGGAHVAATGAVAVPLVVAAVRSLDVALLDLARAVRRPVLGAGAGWALGTLATRPLPDDLAVLVVGAVGVAVGSAAVLRPWRLIPTITPVSEASPWS